LRTNEPSYEHYFRQFVFFQGKRGSQWNGPNWPYQTSQALTAMANLLNNYHQDVVNASDYLTLLRQYAKQHYLPDGRLNLVENYDPNLGGPIVHFYWSNHYNHSTFNNLIVTGLCGLRPAEGDSLVVNPLIDDSIEYFMLQDVPYHGHRVTAVFDRYGKHYNFGSGLTLFVDGKSVPGRSTQRGTFFPIGTPMPSPVANSMENPAVAVSMENLALNIVRKGYPVPSSSVALQSDTSLYQAVDGRIWYFPEITNYWSTTGSHSKTTATSGKMDWFALDFGKDRPLSKLILYLISDGQKYAAPDSITVEYSSSGEWRRAIIGEGAKVFVPNNATTLILDTPSTSRIRVLFYHSTHDVAVSEIECY
jgi:hypothetical protein